MIVEELLEIINPFSAADPPDAPVILIPSRLNWKPAIGSEFVKLISNVPASVFTFSSEREKSLFLSSPKGNQARVI
jgi:hypothetical protein